MSLLAKLNPFHDCRHFLFVKLWQPGDTTYGESQLRGVFDTSQYGNFVVEQCKGCGKQGVVPSFTWVPHWEWNEQKKHELIAWAEETGKSNV